MPSFRAWLLSRQCQLTVQLSASLLLTSLFTIWRPIFFSHACLVPVFVAVIVGSLAQDQHIGTRLQVSAWVLGPTWVAAVLAGCLMTLAKLAGGQQGHSSSAGGYVAATALLGLLGLALLVFLQAVAPPGPGRVMGIIAVLMYGFMVILSVMYPNINSMWMGAVLLLVLGMLLAAVVAMLVGWLVLPSLASDEVWRLTSEALQGAGAVLSYHTSVLMVDALAGGLDSRYSQGNRAKPPAAEQSCGKGVTGAAGTGTGSTPEKPSLQEAAPHLHASTQHHQPQHQHQHQQQQQHDHHDWGFHRAKAASHTRSSIEIAAAGAAVAAASQDAHKAAAEAAAVALSWMDTADDAVSVADRAADSSAGSEHSSAYSIASLMGSDAVADAAAEYSKGLSNQQQEQWRDEQEVSVTAPRGPRLSEQLLLEQAEQQHQQQQAGAPEHGTVVDAWVTATAAAAAVAISRHGSVTLSEGGSSLLSAVGTDHEGLGLRVLQANPRRRSLEGAASLDFMEELDDQAFIEMIRVLSHSKGSAATSRPPAADQAQRLSATGNTAQSAAPGGVTGGRKGLFHSKSAGSALSALSVAGSSTGAADWARAVSPRPRLQQQPSGASDGTALQAGQLQHRSTEAGSSGGAAVAAAVPGQPGGLQVSRADSIISSHASVLHAAPNHHPSMQSKQQQCSRFVAQSKQQPTHPLQPRSQQVPSGVEGGAFGRLWSVLMRSVRTASCSTTQRSGTDRQPCIARKQPLSQLTASLPSGSSHIERDELSQLPPPTTSAQLQPLVGRAKAVLASARLEPCWLRPKGMQAFNADACLKLLDDVELLLVRLSTLEGVSEEHSLMGLQLHQLAHYKGIADALSLIFAQLTAFIAHLATVVGQQETCHAQARKLKHGSRPAKAAGPTAAKGVQATQQPQAVSSSTCQELPAAAALHGQPAQCPTPFASASGVGGVDTDAASMGLSALLSGMERQGSMVSSYLWEKKTGWATAREMLKREMDASLGGYWWSVKKASKKLPVKVPRSREVMILIFLWPICNGVLEACERIEASAQLVLKDSHDSKQTSATPGPDAAARSTGTPASWLAMAPWHRLVSVLHGASSAALPTVPKQQQVQSQSQAATLQRPMQGADAGQDVTQPHPSSQQGAANKPPGALRSCGLHVAGIRQWLCQQQHWAGPLFELMLVKPVLAATYKAVVHDVPAALSSREGINSLRCSRNFQASLKLFTATGSVLLATILLVALVPVAARSVPIFGYAAVVLCFQPRVEATVDQAARRVFGTVLGACLGLATNSIPNVFHKPWLLLACLAVASTGLGVLARPQRRTAIVLAVLTLCAVSLCGYEAACCSGKTAFSPLDTFLARMASVVGACIYVAILNRLLLPWYTSDYALEQLADALQQAALLFDQIYHSQLERMRLAELAASQIKQQGPEVLQVHVGSPQAQLAPAGADAPAAVAAAAATSSQPPAAAASGPGSPAANQQAASPAVQLAACEAAEAQLLVVLRQQVLSRLVGVQLSLAKESVSWRRGVLATPPLVLNVLGAMNAVKEALTSQRLALAPFTKQGAVGGGADQPGCGTGAGAGGGGGMLHTMVHCYSLWALPLHPLWLEILTAVHQLTTTTAAHLRHRPHGPAARAAVRAELLDKLQHLEEKRLELRHGWLAIRVQLHRAVHGGQPWVHKAAAQAGVDAAGPDTFWPTDSVHLFTFTYGVSRCLNAFAAAAQAVANSLDG